MTKAKARGKKAVLQQTTLKVSSEKITRERLSTLRNLFASGAHAQEESVPSVFFTSVHAPSAPPPQDAQAEQNLSEAEKTHQISEIMMDLVHGPNIKLHELLLFSPLYWWQHHIFPQSQALIEEFGTSEHKVKVQRFSFAQLQHDYEQLCGLELQDVGALNDNAALSLEGMSIGADAFKKSAFNRAESIAATYVQEVYELLIAQAAHLSQEPLEQMKLEALQRQKNKLLQMESKAQDLWPNLAIAPMPYERILGGTYRLGPISYSVASFVNVNYTVLEQGEALGELRSFLEQHRELQGKEISKLRSVMNNVARDFLCNQEKLSKAANENGWENNNPFNCGVASDTASAISVAALSATHSSSADAAAAASVENAVGSSVSDDSTNLSTTTTTTTNMAVPDISGSTAQMTDHTPPASQTGSATTSKDADTAADKAQIQETNADSSSSSIDAVDLKAEFSENSLEPMSQDSSYSYDAQGSDTSESPLHDSYSEQSHDWTDSKNTDVAEIHLDVQYPWHSMFAQTGDKELDEKKSTGSIKENVEIRVKKPNTEQMVRSVLQSHQEQPYYHKRLSRRELAERQRNISIAIAALPSIPDPPPPSDEPKLNWYTSTAADFARYHEYWTSKLAKEKSEAAAAAQGQHGQYGKGRGDYAPYDPRYLRPAQGQGGANSFAQAAQGTPPWTLPAAQNAQGQQGQYGKGRGDYAPYDPRYSRSAQSQGRANSFVQAAQGTPPWTLPAAQNAQGLQGQQGQQVQLGQYDKRRGEYAPQEQRQEMGVPRERDSLEALSQRELLPAAQPQTGLQEFSGRHKHQEDDLPWDKLEKFGPHGRRIMPEDDPQELLGSDVQGTIAAFADQYYPKGKADKQDLKPLNRDFLQEQDDAIEAALEAEQGITGTIKQLTEEEYLFGYKRIKSSQGQSRGKVKVGEDSLEDQVVSTESIVYQRTESEEHLVLRELKTMMILRHLSLDISPDTYNIYCECMQKLGLTPFSKEYLVKLNLVRILGFKGYLFQRLPHYMIRSGQLVFIDKLVTAIARKQMLVIEAGTGTGKTFSYFLPPLLGSNRIVVSTATKVLQDQLNNKDLPNLRKMLSLDHVHGLSIKGYSNYICRFLLDCAQADKAIKQNDAENLQSFVFQEVEAIERDHFSAGYGELKFALDSKVRSCVTCDSSTCHSMPKACPYNKKKQDYLKRAKEGVYEEYEPEEHCFQFMLRQEAKKRQALFINHHLFFASNGLEYLDIPKPNVLIFDEAHGLVNSCRQFMTKRVSKNYFAELVKRVHDVFVSSGVSTKNEQFRDCLTQISSLANILARFILAFNIKGQIPVQHLKYWHTEQCSPFQLFGPALILPHELAKLKKRDKSSFLYSACLQCEQSMQSLEYLQRAQASRAQHRGERGFYGISSSALGVNETSGEDKVLNLFNKALLTMDFGLRSSAERCLAEIFQNSAMGKMRDDEYKELEHYWALVYAERLNIINARSDKKGAFKRGGVPDYEYDLLFEDNNNKRLPLHEPLFYGLTADLWRALQDLASLLAENQSLIHFNKADKQEKAEKEIELLKQEVANLKQFIPDFMNSDRDKAGDENWINVSWVQSDPEAHDFELVLAPVDVSEQLGNMMRTLHQSGVAMVFTSATITTERNFDKFCRDMGLRHDEITQQMVDSPFDFNNHACLMISDKFPDPNRNDRIIECVDKVADAIEATPGGVFFLTTSVGAMKQAKQLLEQRFGSRRRVLMQGDDSNENLLNIFRKDGRAILVGTSSFWEGVDVQGRALSLLIIDKIPFTSVREPLQVARSNWYDFKKDSFFLKENLPDAIIKLRQGVGRLIRNENDYGALIIMDPRLITKAYGAQILQSLPNMRIVKRMSDVINFLHSIAK